MVIQDIVSISFQPLQVERCQNRWQKCGCQGLDPSTLLVQILHHRKVVDGFKNAQRRDRREVAELGERQQSEEAGSEVYFSNELPQIIRIS